ncbi:hypothetical protein QTP70_034103 [Hemibagrus guttatus]|uniref:Uncharacterized protein n=1 Tax=Hemibagrus guttatus TaxID=175788 RepID=A0AAE0PV45_9TELE|nr:hypothetical protein QTP70_034103 [Hemibagrus guttatus]
MQGQPTERVHEHEESNKRMEKENEDNQVDCKKERNCKQTIRVMEVIFIINITCEVILSVNGYTYPVFPNISSDVLQEQDCEQAWYRKLLTMKVLLLLFCVQVFAGTGFTYPVPSDIPVAVLQDQDFEKENSKVAEMQINTSCDQLSSGDVFNYTKPDFLQRKDCEVSWKSQDDTVLGIDDYLIRQSCESGIRLIARCFNPSEIMEFIFNVINSTVSPPHATETPGAQTGFNSSTTAIIVVILLVFGLLIGCYILKKVIDRCAESLCTPPPSFCCICILLYFLLDSSICHAQPE